MNWKQFLMPDSKRIIIVSIGIILFTVFSLDASYISQHFIMHGEIVFLFAFPIIFILGFLNNIGLAGSMLYLVGSISIVIFLYIVSCLIVYANDKKTRKFEGSLLMLLVILTIIMFIVLSLMQISFNQT